MMFPAVAERMGLIDSSGIRKVFDLAQELTDPVDLSIGQPDFDVPEPVKRAAIQAIQQGQNGYTVTQGIEPLREKLREGLAALGHEDRDVFITSGTSGGLVLALMTLVNPGDEVLIFDPYFVMYKHLVNLAGGKPVFVPTYPDFRLDADRVRAACTERTRLILVNSPSNPTGAVAETEELKAIAEVAHEKNLAVVSDEIYRLYCFDTPFRSMAEFDERAIVLDGFSKSHGMTGWRLGYAHGPKHVMQEMCKLQQFTFVCAPNPVQHAGLAAMDVDTSDYSDVYRAKRDRLVEGMKANFRIRGGQGAFYLFPEVPWGTGTEFVSEAIRNNCLVIPGNVFSEADTHFRIAYAADDRTLDRGIEILNRVAEKGA